jgi:hypothetical protein
MTIKQIFDEISAESGSNRKMEILAKYKDNTLLEQVLYAAKSKRIKFYIKQIPAYKSMENPIFDLNNALISLTALSKRQKTGHEASEHLASILSSLSNDDAYVVERIIEKDLKIGLGTTYINKVFPSLIEKTPYMGAKSFDMKAVEKIIKKGNAKSNIKMDGRYQNGIVRNGDVLLETRAGEDTILPDATFMKELATLTDEHVLNGELTIIGVPVRSVANGIISSLDDIYSKTGERTAAETDKKIKEFFKEHAETLGGVHVTMQDVLDRIVYTCWDIITVDEYYAKSSKEPYSKRFEKLENILKEKNPTRIQLVESADVKTIEDVMNHFLDALKRGLEGTIVKDGDGEWKDGKPSYQVKFKLEMNIDLKIVGFQYGDEGTKNEHVISTLMLESSCGLLKTNPSGMNEKMMADITARQQELLGTIVEIRCCGLSKNSKGEWSTAHPSIEELRTDKTTCDSLESAKRIEEAAKTLSKK